VAAVAERNQKATNMKCNRCHKPILAGQHYCVTKKGRHHYDCRERKRTPAVAVQRVVSLLAYLDKCAKPLEMMLKNFKGSRKYKKWWTGEMRALNKAPTTAKALVKEKQANDQAQTRPDEPKA